MAQEEDFERSEAAILSPHRLLKARETKPVRAA
jgi:hypothetical protein